MHGVHAAYLHVRREISDQDKSYMFRDWDGMDGNLTLSTVYRDIDV